MTSRAITRDQRHQTTPSDTGLDVVTGAFSFSGRAIAQVLLDQGRQVRTLTGHPRRAPVGSPIETYPLDFANLPSLAQSLKGATTLYNTYWIRFANGRATHDQAVTNSRTLFHAAHRAGVQRIVHVSITHPSIDSPYSYFRGKALVERDVAESGLPYTIVRPAILFGGQGVLVNNIAWLLRRLPVFAIGGDGQYRVRGVHLDDLAQICVSASADIEDSIIDAVGPERPTFLELVQAVKTAVHSRSRIVHLPGSFLPALSRCLGLALNDVLLTRDEYGAMADGLADTDGPATGQTAFTTWLADNAETLGRNYANELDLHFN
jgi:nucleoside-diphosphate-sugar epimerase